MMKWHWVLKLLALIIVYGAIPNESARAVITGLTYSVADGFTGGGHTGSHKHSSNDEPIGPINVVAAVAEVGDFFGIEEVRGLVEFDITGQVPEPLVVLEFRVFDVSLFSGVQVGGLFDPLKYEGDIDIIHYDEGADNMEDIADYDSDPIDDTTINTFNTTGFQNTTVVELNVTDLYNQQLADNKDSIGIRLQVPEPPATPPEGAITFHQFRLIRQSDLPELSSATAWSVLFFAGAMVRGRRRRWPRLSA